MNIIKNKKVVRSFGQYINQLNTLAGGVSMAHVEVSNKKNKMVVSVMAPSVNPEFMQVLVEYNKLIVYALLPPAEESNSTQQVASFPIFSQVIQIPFHVAVDQIEALYHNGQLKITLPYAEDRLTKRQAIQIKKI